ncbi:MAG TPA: PA14 domain-containing protein [Thermoguttaceae bacterium]|nr:PA14 domain-containing protein [Thermoguttaceae bacterium]
MSLMFMFMRNRENSRRLTLETLEPRTLLDGTGLNAEYFTGPDLTGLAFERVDPQINFDWAYGSPGAPIGSDYFSVRWTGFVLPRYSEVYTFHTLTDDGVRLWVDDELVIDQWVNQSTTEYTATTYLEAGRQCAVKMEYYENTGRAVARLLWSSSTQPQEVIPSSRLTTLSVPQLEADTRSMLQDVNGLASHSVGLVGFEATANPPATRYAIQVGMSPDAGWLHFDTRDGRTDVYADGTQPHWHTAAEWAGQRLRGLQPDRTYSLYAIARDGQGTESGSMPVASFTTNMDCDLDRSGDVTPVDCSYVDAAILSGGELGAEQAWACDVNDDGVVDQDDRFAVEWRIANPLPLEGPIELYVSLDGSDNNPGTFDEPLATLEGAKAAVRDLKRGGLPREGIVVWIRGGVYERTTTFGLMDVDSGAPDRPIAWRAFPNETVRIVGGKRLDSAWFELLTDASPVWNRIDPAARGQLLKVELAAHGIADYGTLVPRGYKIEGDAALELFFDGQPMQLGRWPNYGFVETVSAPAGVNGRQFTYEGTRPERWTEAEDPRFHGFWCFSWAESHHGAASINTTTQTVTLDSSPPYGVAAGQPYYAYNLLEEIDMPGEWYVDRDTGVLYFWPPGELASGEASVSTLSAALLRLADTSYVTFEGIRFELGRTEQAVIDGGDHNALVDCALIGAGTDAARVSGSQNGLEGCEIAFPGNHGVQVTGGDRYTLTPANNYVRNSDIHHFARWVWTNQPAVRLAGCGQIVAHNRLHDAPHAAIMYTGNDHAIEYNDIFNVCRFSGDAGAVYSGRDWASQGTVVQHNFIHHVTSDYDAGAPHNVHGIYLDDCDSGETVFGNVLYRIGGIALENGGGRDNLFENSVVAWADRGHNADRRGTALINDSPGSSMNMLEKIREFDYQNAPWSTAYPRLAAIPNNYASLDPYKNPGGSTCSRNVFWETAPWLAENASWGAGAFNYYEAVEDNLVDQDPLFIDEAALDLNLRPDSPAFTVPGFEPIPFDEIGLLPGPPRWSPADGELAELRPTLCWSEVPGAVRYDVYLGRDEDEVRAADRSSALFQGSVTESQFTPSANLLDGCTYFWRVDALTGAGTVAGEVHHFTAGPWRQRSVGDVGLLGSMAFHQGTFTIRGGGSDLWGSSDAFHYVYRELSGDGEIVARVAGVEQPHEHTKAGVMIRESLDADSPYADVLLHANGLLAFQYRTAVGGSTASKETSPVSGPCWVKLVREADLFTGYVSADGNTWTLVGSQTVAMADSVTVGLAVTAHDNATLATARFEQVAVRTVAEVVGRYVFYNNSAFDGGNPAANADDDSAIAPDPASAAELRLGKTALLPGQTASFENYTSYSRGINGIMVDIADLAEMPTLSTWDDFFAFTVGNDDTPDDWSAAPDPVEVAVRAGHGVADSHRVTIIWADGAVQKQWVQVTVLANEHTGLQQNDVFYFGNAVAESGNSAANARVTIEDLLLARNNPRNFLNPAPIDCPYDYNHDRRVNATDVLLARNNQTSFLTALRLVTPEQAPPALATEGPLPATEPEVNLGWLSVYEQLTRRDQSEKSSSRVAVAVDKLLATHVL